MKKSIIILGKINENFITIEENVISLGQKTTFRFDKKKIAEPNVLKFHVDEYNCDIWALTGDVNPNKSMKILISKTNFILLIFNLSDQKTLDFLIEGWIPIIESAKETKKVFNQKQILIGTYFNEKPKITSDFKQKINFMKEKYDFFQYFEQNANEISTTENNLFKFIKNEIFEKEEKEEEIKNDEKIEEKQIEEEEENTKIYKYQQSINYDLYEPQEKAILSRSQNIKGNIFIPTSVSYKNKEYEIIKIGEGAFSNSMIETLLFASDSAVMIIGNSAFEHSSLKKLFIPKSLQKLNNLWCKGADMLNEIEVDSKNKFFSIKDDFLIYEDDKSKSKEILFSPRDISGEYSVPEGITRIGNYSFSNRERITSVKSSSSTLDLISSYSFYKCVNLKSLTFDQNNRLSLGKFCFSNTEKLSTIDIRCKELKIQSNCFSDCPSLTTINIKSEGKTTLCPQAFKNCTKIQNITFSNISELSIGEECFGGSENLNSISFNEINKITLSEQMFKNCKNLESITVSKINELSIEKECFKNLRNLKSIGFIADSIIYGENIFFGCTSLTYINIQSKSGKITINSNTFENSLLKNVTIDVPKIILRSYCFHNLKNLESFEMTCSEIEIGYQCFQNCSSLRTFSLKCEKNINITSSFFEQSSIEKLVIETKEELKINKESLIELKKLKEVIISGKFIIVDDSNFKDCESLTTFTIKDSGSVQIGNNQFLNCKNLEKIHISSMFDINPGKGQKIDFKSFDGASNLKEIYLAGCNIIISNNCFRNCKICKSLTKIVFDNAVKISLGKESFNKFSNLEEINISSNILEIDEGCFKKLNVKAVTFQCENITIGNKCFQECKKIFKFAIIGAQTVKIGESAFNKCENLHKVSIDAAASLEIFGNCFSGAKNIESIELVGNEITVGTKTFFNCTSIQYLKIENSEKVDLGDNAFDGCTGLKTVYITAKTECKAGKSCFNNLTKLDFVQILSQQVIIDQSCFYNCSSMTLFVIPRAEKTFLLANAFENCYVLKAVDIISTNFLKIDVFCFYKTYKLDAVRFDSKSITFNGHCFENCSSLKKVNCPSSDTIRCYTTSFNNSSHINYLATKKGTNITVL